MLSFVSFGSTAGAGAAASGLGSAGGASIGAAASGLGSAGGASVGASAGFVSAAGFFFADRFLRDAAQSQTPRSRASQKARTDRAQEGGGGGTGA